MFQLKTRSLLPSLAVVCAPLAAHADVAPLPQAPETPSEEVPQAPEFGLGPVVLYGVDGAVISTETVLSADGEVHIARIRPWDAARSRVVSTSWASLTVYPRGLTLPGGERATVESATDYSIEYVVAELSSGAAVTQTTSTVPVAGAQRDAVRLDVTVGDTATQITIGSFAVGDAIVVFTMLRNDSDGEWFAPLRQAMEQIERVATATNEVP